MKTKNLMIGMLLVGVILVSSFVFAGITGAVVREGKTQSIGSYDVTLRDVQRDGTTEVVVTDKFGKTESVIVSKDGTGTTSAGVQVQVTNVKTPFLSRPRAIINITNITQLPPIRFPLQPLVNQTNQTGNISSCPFGNQCAQGIFGMFDLNDCAVYGGAGLNVNKTGYQNCAEKGYDKFCLIHRVPIDTRYSVPNCGPANIVPDYKFSFPGMLTCDNFPISAVDSQQCLDLGNGSSLYKEVVDSVICCR